MAFVQVKNLLQTWKIAAFIVAFFSSFFSYSIEIDFSKLEGKPPKTEPQCVVTSATGVLVDIIGGGCEVEVAALCKSLYPAQPESTSTQSYRTNPSGELRNQSEGFAEAWCTYTNNFWAYPGWESNTTELNIGNIGTGDEVIRSCPPDGYPGHTIGKDTNGSGEINTCYHPNDVQAQLNEENELDKNEDYCKSLVLDSGNNVSSSACYSAPNGSACSVSKVIVGDATYYKGTSNNPAGCGSSDEPPYDTSGTGDEKDDCLFSNGKNYCEANRDKHCSNSSGTEICDDGCIDSGDKVFCDSSKHPDVGEGESDYFNDNGTCSVISASGSKGFCEEMGGTWDETQDYTETVCPVGAGTCSVSTGGHCQACFDAGGTWTPDPNAIISDEAKASIEIAALVKKGNTKLQEIENTSRKASEALTSTVKSGNGKVVAALETLTKVVKDKPTGGGAAQEERETYTTTTGDIDKSKLTALFDDASKAALEADITQLQADTTTFINTAKAEATALMSITVPNSAGYEARNLTLSQGTFDVSLSRFSSFFQALSGAVMLLCSILAGFILLGGKN